VNHKKVERLWREEGLHLTPHHKRLIVDTGQNRLMVHELELPETSSFETSTQYLGGAGRSHFSADG
jgi:hypothetical protein